MTTEPPLSLCHHLPDLVLEQKKQGFYVHSEDAVKGFLSLMCEQPVFTGDPSIVKCVIEPSEGSESEWYDPLHLLGLAEVSRQYLAPKTRAFLEFLSTTVQASHSRKTIPG